MEFDYIFGKNSENLILKVLAYNDDMHMTEDGKYIIFRNVRGKVIPIETDSADYADWLVGQGVQINPSSQADLAQIEKYLDQLTKVREVSGPDAAAKYEQQLLDYVKKQTTAAQGMGYQQALENRAKSKGVSVAELQQHYNDLYAKNKDNSINAAKDKTSEWSYFLGHYTDDMLSRSSDPSIGSAEWGAVKAYDLVLMGALQLAKQGVPPSQISIEKILESEIKDRKLISANFDARYDPGTTDEEYNIAVISLLEGLETLKDNVDRDTDFGKGVVSSFNNLAAKMFSDFDKPNRRKMAPMSKNMVPDHDFEVPDELPDTFGDDEASSLMRVMGANAGKKLPVAHKVLMHTMARLFDQISPTEATRAAVEFSHQSKGIHQLHKLNFIRGFTDYKEGLGHEIDPEELVEEALRKALKLKDSKNPVEITAGIKKIIGIMGTIDGYYAAKNNKGVGMDNKDAITKLWHDSPIQGGRQKGKGEGPNLLNLFIDPSIRENSKFSNETLRIVHSPKAPTVAPRAAVAAAQNPVVQPTAAPENTPPLPNQAPANTQEAAAQQTTQSANIITKYDRSGSTFTSKDGSHTIEIIPKGADPVSGMRFATLKITTSDGRSFEPDDKIYVPKDPKEQHRFFNDALLAGSKFALQAASQPNENSTPNTTPTTVVPEVPVAATNPAPITSPRAVAGNGATMSSEALKAVADIQQRLTELGLSMKEVVPRAWSVTTKDGKTIGFSYRKDTGSLVAANPTRTVIDSADTLLQAFPELASAGSITSVPIPTPEEKLRKAAERLTQNPQQIDTISKVLEALKTTGKYTAQVSDTYFSIQPKEQGDRTFVVRVSPSDDGSFSMNYVTAKSSGGKTIGLKDSNPERLLAIITNTLEGSEDAIADKLGHLNKENNIGVVNLPDEVKDTLDQNFDMLAELHDADFPQFVKKLKDHAAKHNLKYKDLHEYMKQLDKDKHGENRIFVH